MQYRVVIADNHPAVLKRLRALLEPEFEVVASASDGLSTLEKVDEFKPDAVVLDLSMPGCNGLEVIRRMKLSGLNVASIIVSASASPALAKEVILAGARAFVVKSRAALDLKQAVRQALENRVFLSPGME